MSLVEKSKSNRRRCCVPGCKSVQGGRNSLHRFPSRDKNLYEKWLQALDILKPSKEMYVCSRHFGENDFFGGWLAVEPNKRRLKRGVVPYLELPKLEDCGNSEFEIDQKNSFNDSQDFVTYLNLKPVNAISDYTDSDPSKNVSIQTKEDATLHTEEISNNTTGENFEAAGTDDLLILKRVSEIREAPESRAKKKHEAQVFMKKMREFKKEFNKLSPSTTKIKVRKIQELTHNLVENVGEGSHLRHSDSQPQLKKIRLLSQSDVETMRKKMHFQVKNIRILPKTEEQTQLMEIKPEILNNTELSQSGMEEVENLFSQPYSQFQMKDEMELSQSEIKKREKLSRQRKNTKTLSTRRIADITQFGKKKMYKVHESQHSRRLLNTYSSEEELCGSNKGKSDQSKGFEKIVNDTINYFDSVIDEFDKESGNIYEKPPFKVERDCNTSSENKQKDINILSDTGTPVSPSFEASVNYLEKMVVHLSSELSLNGYTSPVIYENQATQTKCSSTENKSMQTDSESEQFARADLKIKNENATLKKEIMVLKSKIALLERELLGDRKTQLLYVINS